METYFKTLTPAAPTVPPSTALVTPSPVPTSTYITARCAQAQIEDLNQQVETILEFPSWSIWRETISTIATYEL